MFNVKEFRDWAASKPADEKYESANAHTCAFGQFGLVGGGTSLHNMGVPHDVYSLTVHIGPYTFGALVERLDQLEMNNVA